MKSAARLIIFRIFKRNNTENQNKNPSPVSESKPWLNHSWERKTVIFFKILFDPTRKGTVTLILCCSPPQMDRFRGTEWTLHMSVRERDLSLLPRIGKNTLKPLPFPTVTCNTHSDSDE